MSLINPHSGALVECSGCQVPPGGTCEEKGKVARIGFASVTSADFHLADERRINLRKFCATC